MKIVSFHNICTAAASMIDEVMQCRVADCDGKVIIAK